MARGHQIAMLSNLAIRQGTVPAIVAAVTTFYRGKRRRSAAVVTRGPAVTAGAAGKRHVFHARVNAPHLDVPQLLLEELKISSAISHLGVETGADSLVVGLAAHGGSGLDQGLFAVNLLLDVLHGFFVLHGGLDLARFVRARRRVGVVVIVACVFEGVQSPS